MPLLRVTKDGIDYCLEYYNESAVIELGLEYTIEEFGNDFTFVSIDDIPK